MWKTEILEDLSHVVSSRTTDARALYDRAAPRYQRFRDLWLSLAGEDTERAMLEGIAEVAAPGCRVLDAGAGTGGLSRRILEVESSIDLTMLDLSEQMLRRAADVPGHRLLGSVDSLPFSSDHFDLVVSAWVIETVPERHKAVSEFLRVLSPRGTIFYTFCSLPDGWLSKAGSAFLRKAVRKGFAGKFLKPEETPWHNCSRSRLVRFHGGLSTLVALHKCCSVGDGVLPDAPCSWEGGSR